MNVRTYEIREATIEDLGNLVSMRLKLQHHIEEKNSMLWKISDKGILEIRKLYTECLNSENSKLIVACATETGQPVGMGFGRLCFHEKYIPGKSGRIDDIWVEPLYRKQGICTEIMQKILKYFKSHDIESVMLDYVVGNEIAEKIWAKFGFRPILVTATISNQSR